MAKSGTPILIKLDKGLIWLLDHETSVVSKAAKRRVPRTNVVRDLLVEALHARASKRGESVLRIQPVEPE